MMYVDSTERGVVDEKILQGVEQIISESRIEKESWYYIRDPTRCRLRGACHMPPEDLIRDGVEFADSEVRMPVLFVGPGSPTNAIDDNVA